MDKYLGLLGSGIKSTYHFLSDYFSHLSAKWQDEQIYKQQLHNNNLRYDISYMIREELYSVLCHCNYSFINIFCSDNIDNLGWDVHFVECWHNNIPYMKEYTIYHYDIYTSNPPNAVALEQIRKNINLKIGECQQHIIQQYGHELAQLTYPCIYSGMYISSIKCNGCMVHFEITCHLSP